MALAFSRKYRPRSLSDVLGQDVNIELIKNAAKQDKIGHAYLLYGPRGTGKTTIARLIAKLANCEARKNDATVRASGEPCNECRSCQEINTGTSLDVFEIDAASNRGIDEIRNLKENVRTAPALSSRKVYIIDEAHMLTTPAFNALLKTLEEPPPHVLFVLATTEYEKLPPTITSRTQRFLFKRLAKDSVLAKLKSIALAEHIDIDEDALDLVASAADGSVRDAESLLEQLSTSAEHLSLETVERLTGRTTQATLHAMAAHMMDGRLTDCMNLILSLQHDGHNVIQFTKDLIHYVRKLIAVKVNPATVESLRSSLTSDELKKLRELAARVNPAVHVPLLKALIRAYGEMRYSPFTTIPLEIALIEQLGSSE